MLAFLKSVMVGTLAGAWLPLIFTVFMAMFMIADVASGREKLTWVLAVAIAPILVTLPIVLLASLLIGLPATFVLKRFQAETCDAYVWLGAVSGFGIPLVILGLLGAQEGWWMSLLGAFSGGMTGRTWWASRLEPLPPGSGLQ